MITEINLVGFMARLYLLLILLFFDPMVMPASGPGPGVLGQPWPALVECL